MSNSSYELVEYTSNNQVAVITLNRPQAMNSFDRQLRDELYAAFTEADADDNNRVIIITGSGRGFSAGQDLADMPDGGVGIHHLLIDEYNPILNAIDSSPKLTIAAVNGAAAGIGGSLALVCDFTVMADNAFLFQAFLAVGLIPDGGMHWFLAQQVGYKRALELIVGGEKLPAATCVELGLANRVEPADELLANTVAWAEELAQKAPLAVRYSKRALKEAMSTSFNESLVTEAALQAVVSASDDAAEGIKAFVEKRKAVFTGK